jgi:hypothetical protein
MDFNFNILYEIIGYAGTVLVVLSMMMTSVVKLRIVNICGSVLSMTYAFISNTWPIVLMNAALIVINLIQLIRSYTRKINFNYKISKTSNTSFKHFIEVYNSDILKFFNNITFKGTEDVFLVYIDTELVGILVGEILDGTFNVLIDYAIPKYRDLSVAKYLFPILKEHQITKIIQPKTVDKHNKYLLKMGFELENDLYTKKLD